MSGYYPELGEQPDTTKLFQASHVIGDTYSLRWSLEDDERARCAFRSARVRPNIEFTKAENTYSGKAYWSACCTSAAYRKLHKAGLTCLEMLLD